MSGDFTIPEHIQAAARRWRLTALAPGPASATACIWHATLSGRAVVIKAHVDARAAMREARCLSHFAGRGSVELIAHDRTTLLLERIRPGTSLGSLVEAARDDDATTALCEIAAALHSGGEENDSFERAEDMLAAFDQAVDTPSVVIPKDLIHDARVVYRELAASQSRRCLLHGDLHHDNVLLAAEWIAIDPKGVIAEREFEFGACLRNPAFHATPERAWRQAIMIADRLSLDRDRIYAWGFTQAVLAAIWAAEDGIRPDFGIHAAEAMRRSMP